MNARSGESGFTLVEMLVALAIFGMLAAAGVTVMRSTLDSQTAVRGEVDRLGEFQRLRAAVRADLGQAALRSPRTEAGERAPAFAGGAGDPQGRLMALVRRGWDNPDQQPRASLQYVEYRLVEDRLERRVRTTVDGAALQPPQVLAHGVKGASIAFFGQDAWLALWDRPTLPEAVRLDLTLEGLGPVTQYFLTAGSAR